MKKILVILFSLIFINVFSQPLFNNSGQVLTFGGNYLKTFKPTEITGLVLWLDASQGVTKDGFNYINQWNDISGQGNNATQATGASQPLYVASFLNDKPVIRFDGINDYLVNTTFTLPQPFTIFIISKLNTTTSNPYSFLSSPLSANSYFYDYIYSGGNYAFGASWGADFYSSSYTNVQPKLLSIILNGASSKIYRNALELSKNGAPNINTSFSGYRVGNLDVTQFNYDGDIAEIIVYNSVLSDIDRATVEFYLNAKYNIY